MVSRRDFLRNSAFNAISLPICLVNSSKRKSHFTQTDSDAVIFGRVLFDKAPIFPHPDENSTSIKFCNFNEVLSLSHTVKGSSKITRNEIWYGIGESGYIQSKNIQLVRNDLFEPQVDISITGQLAEITVPFSKAWPKGKQRAYSNQIFFYGSTHWVYGIGKDSEGKLYYLVVEDRWGDSYYVDALHMRIIDDHALAPSAPEIEPYKKSVLVDTKNQLLIAYEEGTPVMISPISSGIASENMNLNTPPGEYTVTYKRPSRHMVHSDKVGINDRELYGVPWVTYFTDTGIGFHGTYWHNDYSHPHSHGCVNMPIHAARWIYLWTDPVVPPREKKHVSKIGTRVKVV
jgi:hypothetical protein